MSATPAYLPNDRFGFAPGFTQTVNAFAQGLGGDGVNAVQSFGQASSDVFKQVATYVLDTATDVIYFVQQIKLAFSEYESLEAHIDGFFDKIDARHLNENAAIMAVLAYALADSAEPAPR